MSGFVEEHRGFLERKSSVHKRRTLSATKVTGLQGALTTVFTRSATVVASLSRSILMIPVYLSARSSCPASFVMKRIEQSDGVSLA